MKASYLYGILIIALIGGLIFVRNNTDRAEAVTAYDGFAQCLADKGATFYGAFWCQHCQEQKALMDNSSKIPYVECSTPDTRGQTPICIEKGVTGYPTWHFADDSVGNGRLTLEELATKTGCELPVI